MLRRVLLIIIIGFVFSSCSQGEIKIVIIIYKVKATLFSCVNDMCEGYDLITSEVCVW